MLFSDGSKLLMIGDSITDAGRARPAGEGRGDALGKGYVAYVDALLAAAAPRSRIRVVNQGISGNTIRDLAARWDSDVLDLKPDWVSVMIGINDVWRQHDMPLQTHTHVYLDEYARTLDELASRTLPHVRGMVLMTPYFIEPNRKDSMRAMMDRYGRAVRSAARKHRTVLVDTQAAFDRVLGSVYSAALAWDRVHPVAAGHMILARAFLQAVGFRW